MHPYSFRTTLNRSEAVVAVLIPIKKSVPWLEMSQDERRAIFEEESYHTAVGLEYLPGVARRLLHCRDLGEPFDFLTWFEFAPEHTQALYGHHSSGVRRKPLAKKGRINDC